MSHIVVEGGREERREGIEEISFRRADRGERRKKSYHTSSYEFFSECAGVEKREGIEEISFRRADRGEREGRRVITHRRTSSVLSVLE